MRYDKYRRTSAWEGPFRKDSWKDVLLASAIGFVLAALLVWWL